MELINIEEIVANVIETGLAFTFNIKKRKRKDYKYVYAYHTCIVNIENGVDIFNHPKEYLSLVALVLTGFLKVDGEIIDFSEKIHNGANQFEQSQYFLALAYLITLDYLENHNLYKAALNALDSLKFIIFEVNKPRDLYEDFRVSIPLLKLFDQKVPEVLELLYEGDHLIK